MTDETNDDQPMLDIFTASCKFWAPSGGQVSVAAEDEEDARRQVLDILSDHRDAEIVAVHNVSQVNMPSQLELDLEEDDQEEVPPTGTLQ